MFIAAFFIITKAIEMTPKYTSANHWSKQNWYIHAIEYYSHTKRNETWCKPPHGYILKTFRSVQFSRSVMSDSLRPHESEHARPSCPSPTPRVDSNSCALGQWCHPAISSSVVPFSCPQSLPASGSFPMSQLFENIRLSELCRLFVSGFLASKLVYACY